MKKSISTALLLAALAGAAQAAPINAFTVVVPRVDIAAAGSAQVTDPNLITWQAYDTFSGSALDASLWRQVQGGAGTVSTGANGLTLTPQSLSDPGKTNLAIQSVLPVPVGGYFAFRLPFLVTSAVTDLTGFVDLNVNICAPLPAFPCDSLNWLQANNVIPPAPGATTPFSGTAFAADADEFNQFLLDPTTVFLGQLAIIYSGDTFWNFINDGTGWRQLGSTFLRPAAWTSLLFEFDAEVQVLPVAAVPEPGTLALLALALAGLAGVMQRRAARR